MEAQIIRKKGIEDFVGGYSPGKVEEESEGNIKEPCRELLKKYEYYLNDLYDDYIDYIEDVLTPEEIEKFLPLTVALEKHPNYQTNTGKFITMLIRNSYWEGYNDFTLNTKGLFGIHNLAKNLYGSEGNTLKLRIDGDVGMSTASQSTNIDLTLNGSAKGFFANQASASSFVVRGDLDLIGTAFCCSYDLEGNLLNRMLETVACTFKTRSEKTLQQLIKNVPAKIDGNKCSNKIIFIHETGEEEVVMDYS